jgi:crotonobetainyl-CoA:carnitine CoA-transferase CaiB-like acyl-CoA transferase
MSVLKGYRVLDFGRYIAGPYCAALLGDMGADVIRIEKVSGGEDRWLSPIAPDGTGAGHMNLGRNKRGMTLNPRKPQGQEVLRRLVSTADIVVANLPRKGLAAMGIDFQTLRSIKKDIILTTADGYGDEGPNADQLGFDGVGQAMAGAATLTGPEGRPTRAYVTYVDFGTATLAAFATMAAVLHKERTGEGQHVKANLLHTAVSFNSPVLTEQAVVQRDRTSTHNQGQTSGPTDILETTNGWIIVQVVGTPLFHRLAKVINEPGWVTDERFLTDDLRGRNHELLAPTLAGWASSMTSEEALAALAAGGVPAAPVLRAAGTLVDPHIVATNLLSPMTYPGITGTVPVVRAPFTMSSAEVGDNRRAPTLGEHTHEVLIELGYSAADIAELRSDRVV